MMMMRIDIIIVNDLILFQIWISGRKAFIYLNDTVEFDVLIFWFSQQFPQFPLLHGCTVNDMHVVYLSYYWFQNIGFHCQQHRRLIGIRLSSSPHLLHVALSKSNAPAAPLSFQTQTLVIAVSRAIEMPAKPQILCCQWNIVMKLFQLKWKTLFSVFMEHAQSSFAWSRSPPLCLTKSVCIFHFIYSSPLRRALMIEDTFSLILF